MALAWGVSAAIEWHDVPRFFLWRLEWEREDVTVTFDADGYRCENSGGTGHIRWDSGIVVHDWATCFAFDDQGELTMVLPKRALDTTELLVLRARAAATCPEAGR
jgi:hypothetical protein